MLLDKTSVAGGIIPPVFANKINNVTGAALKLVTVDNLVLDLSNVKKWEDL